MAGVTCHLYGPNAIYWSACSTIEGRSMRANPFCLHGAMSLCAELGVTHFELGRFTADESNPKERSITDYKAQFGGQLYAVPTLRSPGGLLHRATGRLRTLVKRVRRGY